ncbi:hypothetical protein JL721_9042 [Aureococcus anophagefferens]|nr:hypothetical protein JL721_9042 [Aureococcus anophagefferens]
MACTWAAGMLPAISTGVRASNAPAMASDLAYDAFMALPDDARRANYEALVRDARSTQHKPMRRVNAQKRERLRTMKVLILDNSQREPSVASVWVGPGVPRPNPMSTTSSARSSAARADELLTFSEFTDGALRDGAPIFDDDHVPVGLRKTAAYGLKNGPRGRHVVYGPRAIEAVFGFTAVGGGVVDRTFDRDASGTAADAVFLADILGVAEKPVRLHTLATPAQFAARLAQCFGAHASFDDALGARLKRGLLALLAAGDKAECTSPLGLALLHQRVEGGLTPAMIDCVRTPTRSSGAAVLLALAEACFDEGRGRAAPGLPYGFAERFVDAYLGARHNTFGADVGDKVRDAVRRSFDLDGDRRITFDEYRVWLLWALRSTQDDIHSADKAVKYYAERLFAIHGDKLPGSDAGTFLKEAVAYRGPLDGDETKEGAPLGPIERAPIIPLRADVMGVPFIGLAKYALDDLVKNGYTNAKTPALHWPSRARLWTAPKNGPSLSEFSAAGEFDKDDPSLQDVVMSDSMDSVLKVSPTLGDLGPERIASR